MRCSWNERCLNKPTHRHAGLPICPIHKCWLCQKLQEPKEEPYRATD